MLFKDPVARMGCAPIVIIIDIGIAVNIFATMLTQIVRIGCALLQMFFMVPLARMGFAPSEIIVAIRIAVNVLATTFTLVVWIVRALLEMTLINVLTSITIVVFMLDVFMAIVAQIVRI